MAEIDPDDYRIAREYHELMNEGETISPLVMGFTAAIVARARRDEPRINCGRHFADWTMICDDDDDFDSFYGADYFTRLLPAPAGR